MRTEHFGEYPVHEIAVHQIAQHGHPNRKIIIRNQNICAVQHKTLFCVMREAQARGNESIDDFAFSGVNVDRSHLLIQRQVRGNVTRRIFQSRGCDVGSFYDRHEPVTWNVFYEFSVIPGDYAKTP